MTRARPLRPFEDFEAALARYPSSFRCLIDAYSEGTAGDWRLLAVEARDRADAYCVEPEPPPKRRRPHHRTPTSTSTGTSRVQFDDNDPLKRIPAAEYLPAIAGVDVSSSGRCRCPMPDHEDVHPSAKCYGTRWHCFSCGAGGTIIDLGAAVYDLEPRGAGFIELRRRIASALLGGTHV
jgi:hypothetical protein